MYRLSGDYRFTESLTLDKPLYIPAGIEVSIDLNGKTINSTAAQYAIYNLGTLTIKDSSAAAPVEVATLSPNGTFSGRIQMISGSALALSNVTLTNDSAIAAPTTGRGLVYSSSGKIAVSATGSLIKPVGEAYGIEVGTTVADNNTLCITLNKSRIDLGGANVTGPTRGNASGIVINNEFDSTTYKKLSLVNVSIIDSVISDATRTVDNAVSAIGISINSVSRVNLDVIGSTISLPKVHYPIMLNNCNNTRADSIVNINDSTLEGWCGIFLRNNCKRVVVNLRYSTIKAISYMNGTTDDFAVFAFSNPERCSVYVNNCDITFGKISADMAPQWLFRLQTATQTARECFLDFTSCTFHYSEGENSMLESGVALGAIEKRTDTFDLPLSVSFDASSEASLSTMYNEGGELVTSTINVVKFGDRSTSDVTYYSIAPQNDISWYSDPNADTYTIRTAAQLSGLAKLVNDGTDNFKGKTIKLGDNIDLNNMEWTPIGSIIAPVENPFDLNDNSFHAFAGNFDGNGKIISNLNICTEEKGDFTKFDCNYLGLFGVVAAQDNTIENITLENVSIAGSNIIGSLIGYIPSDSDSTPQTVTIKNVKVENADVSGTRNVGGILGRCEVGANLAIESCAVHGSTVYSGLERNASFAGGLVGAAYSNTSTPISNVTVANTSVTALTEAVGGIAGLMNVGSINEATLDAVDVSISVFEKALYEGDLAEATYTEARAVQYANTISAGALIGHIVPTGDKQISITGTTSLNNVTISYPVYKRDVFCGGLIGTYRDDSIDTQDPSKTIDGLSSVSTSGLTLSFLEDWTKDNYTADISWYDDVKTEFTISNAAQLVGLSDLVNSGKDFSGKTVALDASIDLNNSARFSPIGNGSLDETGALCEGATPFRGIFNGNGNTISKLRISSSNHNDVSADQVVGLFGIVSGSEATVKNIYFKNVLINTGSKSAGTAVGVLTGGATVGSIVVNDIGDSGTYYVQAPYAGGIVGRIIGSGTVSNCETIRTKATTFKKGFRVRTTADGGAAGGIVMGAFNPDSDGSIVIKGCTNQAVVNATSDSFASYTVGGIIALGSEKCKITDCTTTETVTGGTVITVTESTTSN